MSLNPRQQLQFRPYRSTDESFLYNSFLKGFKSSRDRGPISNFLYWPTYKVHFEELLKQSEVLVAAHKDIEDEIAGYVLYELGDVPLVHWIYVKKPLRRAGVGSALLEAAGIDPKAPFDFTHRVRLCYQLVGEGTPAPHAKYRPQRCWRQEIERPRNS